MLIEGDPPSPTHKEIEKSEEINWESEHERMREWKIKESKNSEANKINKYKPSREKKKNSIVPFDFRVKPTDRFLMGRIRVVPFFHPKTPNLNLYFHFFVFRILFCH